MNHLFKLFHIKKLFFIYPFLILTIIISCGKNNQQKLVSGSDTLEVLNQLLKTNPNNADTYFQKAQYYFSHDNISETLNNCNKAISLNANNANYHLLKADALLKNGNVNDAQTTLETALKLDPNNVSGHLKLAELSLLMKNYGRATEEAEKAMELNPNNATAYFIKGFVSKESGDTASAVKAYKRATELDSEYEMAFEELGHLYALKNDKLCEEYLSTAIQINPKNTIAMYQLALYYQDNGRTEDALDTYENILSLLPDNANSLHNIGYIYLVVENKPKEAIPYFTKAIEALPTFYEAYYNRAYAYEMAGNKIKAIEDYKVALEINPDYSKAKETLKYLGVK